MVLQVFGGLVPELGLRETSDKERAAQLIVEVAADGADVDAASLRDRVGALIRDENDPVAQTTSTAAQRF
jgi:hypothetical protein